MHFIGIIAQNKTTVQEIVNYFLGEEKYSILFISQSMEDYKLLPVQTRKKADVVFVDTGENYFELLQQLKFLRSINFHYHIVLLSSPQMPRPGTIGFIDKNHIRHTLESCFSEEMRARFADNRSYFPAEQEKPIPFLTNRETEIAELVLKGLTNKKIGETLFISTCTVNAHLRKIFSKLSVKSRTELAYKMINL